MRNARRYVWYAVIACTALAGAMTYFAFDPGKNALFPRCPFLMLTGLKCPGCGSQRALHSLLHLDIAAAAGHNFLLVASLPLVALLIAAELMRKRNPRLYAALNNTRLTVTVFVIVTGWWILRNIIGL